MSHSEQKAKHDGCHECGGGRYEILQSKQNGPVSIALCSACFHNKKTYNQLPFGVRGK